MLIRALVAYVPSEQLTSSRPLSRRSYTRDFEALPSVDMRVWCTPPSAGHLWSRRRCIPMGGSFSAQAADLHSLWSVYTSYHPFYTLSQLSVSPEGFPYWRNAHGTVAPCQFRDNILIATSFSDSPRTHIVETVCKILEQAWDLAVLCDCRAKQ